MSKQVHLYTQTNEVMDTKDTKVVDMMLGIDYVTFPSYEVHQPCTNMVI